MQTYFDMAGSGRKLPYSLVLCDADKNLDKDSRLAVIKQCDIEKYDIIEKTGKNIDPLQAIDSVFRGSHLFDKLCDNNEIIRTEVYSNSDEKNDENMAELYKSFVSWNCVSSEKAVLDKYVAEGLLKKDDAGYRFKAGEYKKDKYTIGEPLFWRAYAADGEKLYLICEKSIKCAQMQATKLVEEALDGDEGLCFTDAEKNNIANVRFPTCKECVDYSAEIATITSTTCNNDDIYFFASDSDGLHCANKSTAVPLPRVVRSVVLAGLVPILELNI